MGPRTQPVLDKADIQGNVLRGYGFGHACYLHVRVPDAERARAWLYDHAAWVTTAVDWDEGKPDTTLNIAVSFQGLGALGVPGELLDAFPVEFREGMQARARRLGDTGPNDPARWEPALRDARADLLVTLHVREPDEAGDAVASLRADLRDGGLHVAYEQCAAALPFGREHFGFSDGFAQPAVAGSGQTAYPGQGRPTKRGWEPVAPGEFVLGYTDEDGVVAHRAPAPFDRNSTYLVWRKLRQHVAAFWRFCERHGSLVPGGPEQVAALLVGRWRDGTPLVLSPDRPGQPGRDGRRPLPELLNDFRYRDDPRGTRCPLGAHVRRTNPRDALGWDGQLTRRHRIMRRGMSYGPPADDPSRDDGVDRGLVFACYQVDIERQFEVVQGHWCADGDAFGLDCARDPLLADGRPGAGVVVPGERPVFLDPGEPFVTTRGGEYFFVPGVAGLLALAQGL